uniref:Photosystem I reaction center subunit PsaK n=1 Tax=Thermostichus vulcanus TaxID=32053 RepID=PSAK_THEVL|nr:RecName: Full=Photosystem I reaction center subunit PsaK; AltName: Full=Light-harvesting 6.5 kDa polypeptide; AltName: Full=Photosystem I subunit X; Flags: Precursor [Thermostichus vulcanus]6K33_aK Chain aK, Photosystem I reaction center subunit PsaK [Thermostichus vulcanus]6K33_bK Chain bK, Photosystem I reaction center subunit PsaK [Thermostichus vulcanus]6K33_cK Chain cK, Photosystem I reaction center subunit PsaK [Thermostichus vulcanus]
MVLATTLPDTTWTPSVGLVVILSNLFAIALGRYAIQSRGKGPGLPIALPALFEGFGLPELLATTSFGHLLAAGVVSVGLQYAGAL